VLLLVAMYLRSSEAAKGPRFSARARAFAVVLLVAVHAPLLFFAGYAVGNRSRAAVIASMDYVVLTPTEPVARECEVIPSRGRAIQVNWTGFAATERLVVSTYVDGVQAGFTYFLERGQLVEADGLKPGESTKVDLIFTDGWSPASR
jgi:hypothetical protein